MLTSVGKFLQEKSLVRGGDRVLCMVSGGADSSSMFHLLNQLSAGTHPSFPHAFSLGICHVNYGRRGDASEGDEIFVRQMADKAQVPIHVIQAPRERHANFQAWARDFRYLAAQNLCRWQGYTRIAVAHNKDDRIETFLYRLMTYAGRRSLVVMPPLKGRIIRPLLFATAAEVRNYCVENGLPYREDESNQAPDYTRNRIRQLLMPQLAAIRPDFRDRITDTLSLLEDEDAVLRTVTDGFWREAAEEPEEPGTTALRAGHLADMPRAAARLVIRRWLSAAAVRVRLSRRLLDSIVSLCRQQHGTATISLSDGLQVERRYDRLMLVGEQLQAPAPGEVLIDMSEAPDEEISVTASSGSAVQLGEEAAPPAEKDDTASTDESASTDDPGTLLTVPGTAVFNDLEIEAVESPGWKPAESGSQRAVIDADRLTGPLRVRAWRAGDRFRPLGLQGSKSLQDLFTDEKVPRPERDSIPVIISGDEIVWVCGLRLSEDFKVTGSSRRLIGLTARRRAVERAV